MGRTSFQKYEALHEHGDLQVLFQEKPNLDLISSEGRGLAEMEPMVAIHSRILSDPFKKIIPWPVSVDRDSQSTNRPFFLFFFPRFSLEHASWC